MDALRVCEIKIHRQISGDLLFELWVRRVDAWVRVILLKTRTPLKQGKGFDPQPLAAGVTKPGQVGRTVGFANKPPAIVCCCTPLVVIEPTCDSMFCRA